MKQKKVVLFAAAEHSSYPNGNHYASSFYVCTKIHDNNKYITQLAMIIYDNLAFHGSYCRE